MYRYYRLYGGLQLLASLKIDVIAYSKQFSASLAWLLLYSRFSALTTWVANPVCRIIIFNTTELVVWERISFVTFKEKQIQRRCVRCLKSYNRKVVHCAKRTKIATKAKA